MKLQPMTRTKKKAGVLYAGRESSGHVSHTLDLSKMKAMRCAWTSHGPVRGAVAGRRGATNQATLINWEHNQAQSQAMQTVHLLHLLLSTVCACGAAGLPGPMALAWPGGGEASQGDGCTARAARLHAKHS